ncbi:MAG: hypothetical protein K1X82_01485 [Bacteroidia bacterium]|nr:hypothetical protein [Bacteroidia bacterium]
MKNTKLALSLGSLLTLVLLVSQSCYYDHYEDLHPKDTTQNTTCDTSNVTYSGQLKAIVDANCANECHNSDYGQFPLLTTYDEVKNGVDLSGVVDRIERQNGDPLLMPQAGRLSDCNISLFKVWKSQGYKQ